MKSNDSIIVPLESLLLEVAPQYLDTLVITGLTCQSGYHYPSDNG